MPQFYDSYYFSPLNLYWDYTKFQYNPKILKKKKKKTIESLYQLVTIALTSYIVLVFVNTIIHNIMNINSC